MTLQYPDMRGELIGYLQDLRDIEYQWKCWVNRQFPPHVQNDEMDYAVHFLLDDTNLLSCPSSTIGVFLYGIHEVDVVSEVCRDLKMVFEKYGTELSDEAYISKPEWARVLESAARAHALLVQNDLVASPEA